MKSHALLILLSVVALSRGAESNDLRSSNQSTKITVKPNTDDVLERIRLNYSAFRDLQFNVRITEYQNGEVSSKSAAIVKMRGPYKIRTEDDNGNISIRNENKTWWMNKESNVGDSFQTDINGDSSTEGSRVSDFFWDVSLWKTRMNATITNSSTAVFDVLLTPKAGTPWPQLHFQVDYAKGFVTEWDSKSADVLIKSEYLKPVELIPGHWLFTIHRHTMQFDSGDKIITESTSTNIKVNQDLPDSAFDIPKK